MKEAPLARAGRPQGTITGEISPSGEGRATTRDRPALARGGLKGDVLPLGVALPSLVVALNLALKKVVVLLVAMNLHLFGG